MTCACGNGSRRDLWNTTTDGSKRYGYKCYNVLNNGHKSNYEKNGINTEGLNLCDMPAISDIKMYLQAKKIFDKFIDKISYIDATVEAMKRRSLKYIRDYDADIKEKESQIDIEKKRQVKYISFLADGTIDKEQFDMAVNNSKEKVEVLKADIHKIETEQKDVKKPSINIEEIKSMLSKILDCKEDVDTDLIDRFVYQIVVKSAEHFVWRLHFKQIETEKPEFVKVYDFTINEDEAHEYTKAHNRQLKQWKPLTVEVEVAI